MAPLTKRKYAKSRQRERRGHQAVQASNSFPCPQCRSEKLAHHVCSSCGYYGGKEVIKIKSDKKKTT
ncbi:MAG TPA: 50S ribosomal protein L32 [Dehalococcoidales bacterium]|nr:50S ribosomal protein L32 [Dehalococcoidales bacterium]